MPQINNSYQPNITMNDIEIDVPYPENAKEVDLMFTKSKAEWCNIALCAVKFKGIKFYFEISKCVQDKHDVVIAMAKSRIRHFKYLFQ